MMEERLPKLLVLGSSLPGDRDGGGVVRDEILRRYARDRYVCCSVEKPSPHAAASESAREAPWIAAPIAPQLRWRGARFMMPLVRGIGFHCVAPWQAHAVIEFGKRHEVEMVWAELQYDALLIARKVADGMGVPFVGTVWDDPEGWFSDRGYDIFSRTLIRTRFAEALRAADNVSTSGERMQEVYRAEYDVDSVILRHGFESPAKAATRSEKRDEIVVGFVGSPYGRDAWSAFLSAVGRLNRSGTLPRISLRVFGGGTFPYRHDDVPIEVRGWQPPQVMLNEVAETDFCYLAYWFEPAKRRHVELSFANKFETYVAAARPVFFHAPKYAGMSGAIRKYGVGLCVETLEESDVCEAVERLVTDAPLRASMSQCAAAAFHAEFNARVMMRNFAALIGVERTIFEETRAPALSGAGR